MRVTCENCNSPYELPVFQQGKLGCPVCNHVNTPRAVNLEDTRPQESLLEGLKEDGMGGMPVKTMIYYPDARTKEDPVTAIQRSTQGKETSLPQNGHVYLQVVEGDQVGATISLTKGRSVLGRDKRSDVTLKDPEVSALHCAIDLYETQAVIRDLGSTNGTVLNGYVVKEDFLKDGDRIQVGGTTLEFHLTLS